MVVVLLPVQLAVQRPIYRSPQRVPSTPRCPHPQIRLCSEQLRPFAVPRDRSPAPKWPSKYTPQTAQNPRCLIIDYTRRGIYPSTVLQPLAAGWLAGGRADTCRRQAPGEPEGSADHSTLVQILHGAPPLPSPSLAVPFPSLLPPPLPQPFEFRLAAERHVNTWRR